MTEELTTREQRTMALKALLKDRILVLDGAMGTAIQQKDLTAVDFGGNELEGCNENLVLTRPDIIFEIHETYLKAGADITETNTFGATPLVLGEYNLSNKAYEINVRASQIAREAAQKYSTTKQHRFVAGSIGPTTKSISVTGGISFEELESNFYEQTRGLFDGGADYLLIETCQDTRNIKAALIGIERLFKDKKERIPVAVSVTIEAMGTMLAGQTVEALVASLSHCELLYLGLNCATGPEFMTDHIRTLAELSPFPVACVPNAGLPDENGNYLETPQMMCLSLGRFIEQGQINVIGGCCGTQGAHIEAFSQLVHQKKPHHLASKPRSFLSGIDYLEITDEIRPAIVGERTNVIGSKKFKKLICEEKFEEAAEVARAQVKKGAHIIDVCLANPDRDELSDMRRFLDVVIKKTKAPLMIDSTDPKVIEESLTYCQGKAIINSINLEDGEERFQQVVPLAKKFGAALVVGTIDEDPVQGMGVTSARKLAIARRSYELLTKKYHVPPTDLYWDPLVFPCGTGDQQYVGSAKETIEGIRLIKSEFPLTKTVLGISNVSFGLPTAGREVLNSVFLYHCTKAGLDLAIVNAEKLERYAEIPEEEKILADDLLYNRTENCISAFAAHFRNKKPEVKREKKDIPLNERLSRYIVEGSKDGLIEDLNEAMKTSKPLQIINGPLMAGMDEVGRLFNDNKLIVAEVLQSAEAMKASVAHLEPFMEKSESSSRGKVLLATVKGDVHDIGKNLVEIILANNGFNVINLGIKIPPDELIRAVDKYKPEIVGLSGLLVKSAQMMVVTAEDFAKAGIKTPILVGGAALSSNFVDKQIAKAYTTGTVAYASDAMSGLELAKAIVNPTQFENLKTQLCERRSKLAQNNANTQVIKSEPSVLKESSVERLTVIPQPTDYERHVWIDTPPIEQIWPYINPMMLYGRHLGIKGATAKLLDQAASDRKVELELREKDPKAMQVWDQICELKNQYRGTPYLRPSAVWQFFKAQSQGDKILLYNGEKNGGELVTTLDLPRQQKDYHLCLADYVHPDINMQDNIAMLVVSVGQGIRSLSDEYKNRGEYLKSHILQALALESAEAFAEFLHAQIRRIWGFADPADLTMMQRFQARYRGKRYSFGYPACPKLSDQQKLFSALKPEVIGVELTDGDMMEPEASVSAIVFHHPKASYFSVGPAGEMQ